MRTAKRIYEVNYGLGSSYDDFIEINSKLKGNLRKKILAHEKRHDSGRYTKNDWKNDFNSKNPYFFESLRFAIRNPEALINFFPFMYSYVGKFWTFNTSSLFYFIYLGSIWSIFFFLLFRVPLYESFLGWAMIYTFTNLLLMGYVHLVIMFKGSHLKR